MKQILRALTTLLVATSSLVWSMENMLLIPPVQDQQSTVALNDNVADGCKLNTGACEPPFFRCLGCRGKFCSPCLEQMRKHPYLDRENLQWVVRCPYCRKKLCEGNKPEMVDKINLIYSSMYLIRTASVGIFGGLWLALEYLSDMIHVDLMPEQIDTDDSLLVSQLKQFIITGLNEGFQKIESADVVQLRQLIMRLTKQEREQLIKHICVDHYHALAEGLSPVMPLKIIAVLMGVHLLLMYDGRNLLQASWAAYVEEFTNMGDNSVPLLKNYIYAYGWWCLKGAAMLGWIAGSSSLIKQSQMGTANKQFLMAMQDLLNEAPESKL